MKNKHRRIYLAEPRGFCAGVRSALDLVNDALKTYKPPIYIFHEIVHNSHIVNDICDRGGVIINNIEDIDTLGHVIKNPVVISAHGVSKKVENILKTRFENVIDATCPLVKQIHKRACRLEKDKYKIILIGKKKHPEIIGTIGQLNEEPIVIEDYKEIELLTFPKESKIAYLTQTTLNADEADNIIFNLKEKYPSIKGGDNICYATKNRQNAIKDLTDKCESILIIGSPNSSNSTKLYELAKNSGVNSYLINDVSELEKKMYCDVRNIGITSGASAPEYLVDEVVSFLSK